MTYLLRDVLANGRRHPMAHTPKYHPHPTITPKIVHTKDHTVSFSMDGGCLLLKVGDDYPCPIDAVATLALANMLTIHYETIVAEARPHQKLKQGKEYLSNAVRP